MTDLRTAVKTAVHARLQGHVGAPVFDHVPDGQKPPVVIIDRIEAVAEGDKGATLIRAAISLQIISVGRSRDAHRAIVAAVQERLDGWKPSPTATVAFGDAMLVSAGEYTDTDGLTHMGDVQIEMFVQRA